MIARAVVFDLDGTLVDSLADLQGALASTLAQDGLPAPTLAATRAYIGDGARQLVERAYVANGAALPAGAVERFLAHYLPRVNRETKPYPGIPEVLDALLAGGMRLAVCTNKPRAQTVAILASTGLDRRFTTVVCGDDRPYRKPDPRHVQLALSSLGDPRGAVMIGDGINDVLAGRAAGLRTIAVRYGYGDADQYGADAVIDEPSEIVSAIG